MRIYLLCIVVLGLFYNSFSQGIGQLDYTFDGDGQQEFMLTNQYYFAGIEESDNWLSNEYNLINTVTTVDAQDRIISANTYNYSMGGYFNSRVIILRHLENGELDMSFGNDGVVFLDDTVFILDVKADAIGNIYCGGYHKENAYHQQSIIYKFDNQGNLDELFGDLGVYYDEVDEYTAGIECIIIDDGFLYYSEKYRLYPDSAHSKIVVGKLDLSGNMDLSFGTNGQFVWISPSEVMRSRIIKNDIGIICFFTSHADTVCNFNGDHNIAFQLNENGELDSNFGTNGSSHFNFGNGLTRLSNVHNSAGKYLLVLTSGYNPHLAPTIIGALNFDGSINTSFGQNGVVVMNDLFPEMESFYNSRSAMDLDSNLIFAGNGLVKILSSGVRDSIFGYNGFTNSPNSFIFNSLVVDNFNRVIATNFEFIATGEGPNGLRNTEFKVFNEHFFRFRSDCVLPELEILTLNGTCEGMDVELLPSILMADQYIWYFNGDSISGDEFLSINNISMSNFGEYELAISFYEGCSDTTTYELIVNPALNSSIYEFNDSLFAEEVNANSYQWLICNSNSTFTMLHSDVSSSFGSYYSGSYCLIIENNGCVDTSECIQIPNVESLSLHPFNEKIILYLYPNPGKTFMTVSCSEKVLELKLYSSHGDLLKVVDGELAELPISIEEFANGYYLVNLVLGDNSCRTISLVIE